ncbi:TEA domain-containing protein [Mycena venus]|uniref:TEA domain-containing protein n=1 Tax=Mycena venus TaxID=2733690 RepID=A0A8H6XIY2_9AGAR|nr:TEA domain-containing protein [Mycena venus]
MTKTGERRTAKQIASRLQQLRESCSKQELQDLFYPSPYSNPSQGQGSVSARPHLLVVIDIIPEDYPAQPYECLPQPWSESENVIHISHYPRRISSVDPTATFTSPSPIRAQSRFAVCTDEGTVHTENGGLLTANEDIKPSHPPRFFIQYEAGPFLLENHSRMCW